MSRPMPRFRPFTPRFSGKGPNGRRACVWCGTEVPKGRRRWCSQNCVDLMLLEHDPKAWARAIIRRDKGVCQLCGFDSRLLARVELNLGHHTKKIGYGHSRALEDEWEHVRECRKLIERHMWAIGFKRGCDYVEADHIVPLIEGGKNTLDNGRCLCVPCHKRETAALAKRLAFKKRTEKIQRRWVDAGQDPFRLLLVPPVQGVTE